MLVRIDGRSERPIYLQIADAIAGHIDGDMLASGDRLPSARSMAKTVNVNMHTVLKAYSELENRGLVEMRRGRGGVVVAMHADLHKLARSLVVAARRQKLDKSEVKRLVDEVWA